MSTPEQWQKAFADARRCDRVRLVIDQWRDGDDDEYPSDEKVKRLLADIERALT